MRIDAPALIGHRSHRSAPRPPLKLEPPSRQRDKTQCALSSPPPRPLGVRLFFGAYRAGTSPAPTDADLRRGRACPRPSGAGKEPHPTACVFKRIFGAEARTPLLIALLNNLLEFEGDRCIVVVQHLTGASSTSTSPSSSARSST